MLEVEADVHGDWEWLLERVPDGSAHVPFSVTVRVTVCFPLSPPFWRLSKASTAAACPMP